MNKRKKYVELLKKIYDIGSDIENEYFELQDNSEEIIIEDFSEEVICMQEHIEIALNILKELV